MALDPLTGLPRRRQQFGVDTDPTGRYGPLHFGYGTPDQFGLGLGSGPTVGTVSSVLPERSDLPQLPNFRDMLLSDPMLAQLRANSAAESVADRAQLSAFRRRALANFGEIPDFGGAANELGLVGDVSTDIDEATRQAAKDLTAAGISQKARIDQLNQDAIRSIRDTLTGRGMFSSGETGYQLGRQTTDYNRANYDARQALVDQLAQAQGSFNTSERQRQNSLVEALMALLAAGGGGGGGSSGGESSPQAPSFPVGPVTDATGTVYTQQQLDTNQGLPGAPALAQGTNQSLIGYDALGRPIYGRAA